MNETENKKLFLKDLMVKKKEEGEKIKEGEEKRGSLILHDEVVHSITLVL